MVIWREAQFLQSGLLEACMGKLMGEVDVVVEEPVAVGSELTKLGVELVVGNGQGGNVGTQVD